MKNILLIGAGRSATALIEYLLKYAQKEDWFLTVADYSIETAHQKIKGHPRAKAIQFDIFNKKQREKEISNADIVISFLLPSLHILTAKACLKFKKNMVTASYVSNEMSALSNDAKNSGLIFLNEMGLDPGIDHMDLMRLLARIRLNGGEIDSVKSYCGGLVAPESDDNPWNYKFTWSPLNVVTAGQGFARYKVKNEIKVVPYRRLFLNTETIEVPGYGAFEAYPNRDSIPYMEKFGIKNIKNFCRSTLRRPGFANAWHSLITIGLTDNSYIVPDSDKLTYEQWIKSYLPVTNGKATANDIAFFLNAAPNSNLMKKIKWLGLLSDKNITLRNATPAQILLNLLEEKWEFKENDRDMVILQTEIIYKKEGKKLKIISSMIVKGEEKTHTAMTFTAGIPAAIGTKLILQEKVKEKGVIIPITPDIYEPALKELNEIGLKFSEKRFEIKNTRLIEAD